MHGRLVLILAFALSPCVVQAQERYVSTAEVLELASRGASPEGICDLVVRFDENFSQEGCVDKASEKKILCSEILAKYYPESLPRAEKLTDSAWFEPMGQAHYICPIALILNWDFKMTEDGPKIIK